MKEDLIMESLRVMAKLFINQVNNLRESLDKTLNFMES